VVVTPAAAELISITALTASSLAVPQLVWDNFVRNRDKLVYEVMMHLP